MALQHMAKSIELRLRAQGRSVRRVASALAAAPVVETILARPSKITQQNQPTYARCEKGHCDALLRNCIPACC